jgi:hypothetical protein
MKMIYSEILDQYELSNLENEEQYFEKAYNEAFEAQEKEDESDGNATAVIILRNGNWSWAWDGDAEALYNSTVEIHLDEYC